MIRQSNAPMGWTHFRIPGEIYDDIYNEDTLLNAASKAGMVWAREIPSERVTHKNLDDRQRAPMPYDKFLEERARKELR